MWQIRRATVDDLDWLASFEQTNFTQPYQAKDLLYELTENPFSSTWILLVDDMACGYGILWVMYDQAQLVKIGIASDYRRNGYGHLILEHLINEAIDQGCELMTLEVRQSNQPAIAFYQKHDFQQVAIRKDYYQNPSEDALLMMKGLI